MLYHSFSASLFLRLALTCLLWIEPGTILSPLLLPQDEERGIKPREYAKNLPQRLQAHRPKGKTIKPAKPPSFSAIEPTETEMAPGTDIGLTIWRLRQTQASDNPLVSERIAVRKKGQRAESQVTMTPVRTRSNVEFSDGDQLRMTIELPKEGFVYILNREEYRDGSLSDPYLVFPSQGDIGKTDVVKPGKLLFLPSETDYFELQRFIPGSSEKTAEVFTLIISPYRLSELPPLEADQPRKVERRQMEFWEQAWGGQIWKFDQDNRAGLPITEAEKKAATTGSITLTDFDLLPQTVFHIANKPGSPVCLTFSIRLGR